MGMNTGHRNRTLLPIKAIQREIPRRIADAGIGGACCTMPFSRTIRSISSSSIGMKSVRGGRLLSCRI